ncbi:MAG: hypothetical protein IPJ77_05380 [Planctomycetes bacterium]|nr:hypothetical protein [Planctomycetota bacterium]
MVSASEWSRRLEPCTLRLPKKPLVRRIEVHPYLDHLGDEEIEVAVVLDPSTRGTECTWERLHPKYKRIGERVREHDDPPYPYVHFQLRSKRIA